MANPPIPAAPVFEFLPSPNARQIPRRPSPLAERYSTTDYKRWHISSGVVVVDEY
jgi:hypothetical protein